MQIEAIDTSCSAGNCPGGDINLKAAGNITLNTGGLLSVYLNGESGDITLQSGNSISIPIIYYNGGGAINLSAPNSIQLNKIVPYDATTLQIPGSITITSNEIDFTGGANSVQATSSPLTLQSFTPNQNIVIGGSENPSTLDLSATNLAALSNDFSSVTIGRSDGTGTITVTGDATFNYPVTLQAEGVGGSINWVNGNITGTGNASITLKADQNITTGSIINSGRNITISSTNGNINTTAGTLDVSSLGNGGAITLSTAGGNITTGPLDSSSVGENGGAIALSTADGNITTGPLDSSSVAGNGGAIALSTADGNITTGPLDSSSVGENGGAIALSTAGGDITTGLLDSSSLDASGGNINLSVTGGTGAIDTTAGSLTSNSFLGGGAITLSTAGGNITTGPLNSSSSDAASGGNINLSVTGGTGAIDTTNGTLNSSLAVRKWRSDHPLNGWR
jgi:hypothetical protein